MKRCKVSSSVSQRKQHKRKLILTNLSNTCVMKKDTGIKVESKSRMPKVKNRFSGRSRNWLRMKWPQFKWMKKIRKRHFPELNCNNFWTDRRKRSAKNSKTFCNRNPQSCSKQRIFWEERALSKELKTFLKLDRTSSTRLKSRKGRVKSSRRRTNFTARRRILCWSSSSKLSSQNSNWSLSWTQFLTSSTTKFTNCRGPKCTRWYRTCSFTIRSGARSSLETKSIWSTTSLNQGKNQTWKNWNKA